MALPRHVRLRDRAERDWGNKTGNAPVEELIKQGLSGDAAARQYWETRSARWDTGKIRRFLSLSSSKVGPKAKAVLKDELAARGVSAGGSSSAEDKEQEIANTLKDQESGTVTTDTQTNAVLDQSMVREAIQASNGTQSGAEATPTGAAGTFSIGTPEILGIAALIFGFFYLSD